MHYVNHCVIKPILPMLFVDSSLVIPRLEWEPREEREFVGLAHSRRLIKLFVKCKMTNFTFVNWDQLRAQYVEASTILLCPATRKFSAVELRQKVRALSPAESLWPPGA